mmetsp:Transcript_42436/g.108573  ORF Transcript_42436/g.108573 Transcript_42436/m.108573 type:complete len:296 (-) Transcript_42436:996-1883(-)
MENSVAGGRRWEAPALTLLSGLPAPMGQLPLDSIGRRWQPAASPCRSTPSCIWSAREVMSSRTPCLQRQKARSPWAPARASAARQHASDGPSRHGASPDSSASSPMPSAFEVHSDCDGRPTMSSGRSTTCTAVGASLAAQCWLPKKGRATPSAKQPSRMPRKSKSRSSVWSVMKRAASSSHKQNSSGAPAPTRDSAAAQHSGIGPAKHDATLTMIASCPISSAFEMHCSRLTAVGEPAAACGTSSPRTTLSLAVGVPVGGTSGAARAGLGPAVGWVCGEPSAAWGQYWLNSAGSS